MAHASVIHALLGRLPDERATYGTTATLRGWSLIIQNLEHVPNVSRAHDGVEINPQALLRKVWGDDFRSYTIVRNPGGSVYGTIWDGLSLQERELIREWELIPWGWFKEIDRADVHNLGIYQCCTEVIGDGQTYDTDTGFVTDSEPPLMLLECDLILHAKKVGREFRSR